MAFANGPANTTDWIALFKEGERPGAPGISSTKYLYVGGSDSPGAGLASGEVTFTGGLAAAGNYVAYFLEKDGYRVLSRDPITVIESTAAQVRTDKQVYNKGEPVTVTFSRGPGGAKDFVAVYAEEDAEKLRRRAFLYVDGTETGEAGVADGSVTLTTATAVPGKFVVYFFAEDDLNNLLAQESFEVKLDPAGPAVTPDRQRYLLGQPVKVKFSGGPGSTSDWIATYPPGELPDGNPESSDWQYVGGTKDYGLPLTEGEITMTAGVNGRFQAGFYQVYFLVNDGYTITGVAPETIQLLADGTPIVQSKKSAYEPGEAITIAFTNSLGNAADWIGIFPKGVAPNDNTATLWNYTDGTRTGTAGITEGELTFDPGLNTQDIYTAYLFENDGYTILAQEDFTVKASGVNRAAIIPISPVNDGTSNPTADLEVVLEDRDTTVNVSTISVKLDGVEVAHTDTVAGARRTIRRQGDLIYAAAGAHTYVISFTDSTGTEISRTLNFTIGAYNSITLPTALFLETFNSTAEGALPAGWTAQNFSGVKDPEIPADLNHLGSTAYNNFLVIDSARLGGSFWDYNDAPETAKTIGPIAGTLATSSVNTVVNGSYVRTFVDNKVLLGISGYHGAGNEILEVTTSDYNLVGKQNIYLSYHALYQQNQDAIAGIEVSNDGGATWHPVIYYLNPADIRSVDNVRDADLTFNSTYTGFEGPALFPDGSGGSFGAFLKAPIDAAAVAAAVPRAEDNASDGVRVEYIRVPAADNNTVRFRIFYAGSDSWYLGIDDFGLYSISSTPEARLAVTRDGTQVTVSWPAGTGLILQSSPTMAAGSWTAVAGVTGTSYTTTPTSTLFYRLATPTP